VDIYMWSCHEALDLGRKRIQITVLRLGWNPKASTPSLVERLFRQREANLPPPPAWPPPPEPGTDPTASPMAETGPPKPPGPG
jgi:hypothetical protein